MKRFMLFCIQRYEEEGGMNDFVGDFNTRKEMMELIVNQYRNILDEEIYIQIFDTKDMKIIIDGSFIFIDGDLNNGLIMLDMDELDKLDNKMKIITKDWKVL